MQRDAVKQRTEAPELRPHLSLALALLTLLCGFRAQAGVIYSTTDLGTGYQLQSDGNRYVSVANGANNVQYLFDKSPNQLLQEYIPGGSHEGDFTMYTISNDSGEVGYKQWSHGSIEGTILFPTFSPWYGAWFTKSSYPVADMNIHGQVVGRSDVFGAAFSDINHTLHGDPLDREADDLNHYINPIPDATLTSALWIDDLGQIVAQSSDDHYYLLRPLELGPPQTVPEPTTLTILACVGAMLGIRSLRRKADPR